MLTGLDRLCPPTVWFLYCPGLSSQLRSSCAPRFGVAMLELELVKLLTLVTSLLVIENVHHVIKTPISTSRRNFVTRYACALQQAGATMRALFVLLFALHGTDRSELLACATVHLPRRQRNEVRGSNRASCPSLGFDACGRQMRSWSKVLREGSEERRPGGMHKCWS